MKNITYISASAGTGKTWKLTEILSQLLIEGKVLPEQVIITTFTEAAAKDIKERAKSKLYDKARVLNKPELEGMAQRLDNALIGTIDSICNTMLRSNWYMLGLAPNPSVMSEADREFYFNQTISEALDPDDLDFFMEFTKLFGEPVSEYKDRLSWRGLVASIIEKKYSYDIDSFKESEEYSLSLAKRLLSGNLSISLEEAYSESKDLISKLKDFLSNSNKKATTKIDSLSKLEKSTNASYPFIIKLLESIKPNNKAKSKGKSKDNDDFDIVLGFITKYSNILESKEVYEYQEKFIKKVFSIAQRWSKTYSDYKQRHNIIDYTDMESYMYMMLTEDNYKEIQQEVSSTFKYIFVDEFQDCSPLQVKIFDRLSDLLPEDGHSYWVGDHKQIIYSWRGADPNLIKAVIDSLSNLPNCNVGAPLDTSWRSLEPIVNVINKVFAPAFSDMPAETVRLKVCPPKKAESLSASNCVRMLELRGSNAKNRTAEIAAYVRSLKDSKEVNMGDVAILCRTNDFGRDIKDALQKEGIPTDFKDKMTRDNRVRRLVCNVLKVISHPDDNLAKAEIAYLTHAGKTLASIIDSKLMWDAAHSSNDSNNSHKNGWGTDFLSDVPLVNKILARRKDLICLSIAKLIESAIIELNLEAIAKVISSEDRVDSTLTSLTNAALQYQSRCQSMHLHCSIDGFLSYLDTATLEMEGDAEGVHIVTYHNSKGREWKYVILAQIEHNPNDQGDWDIKNYAGVNVEHTQEPKPGNLYPPMVIRLQPWILGSKKKYIETLKEKVSQEHISKIESQNTQEARRTMYVGMTRAKNVLVFAVQRKETKEKGIFYLTDWLDEITKGTHAPSPLDWCTSRICPIPQEMEEAPIAPNQEVSEAEAETAKSAKSAKTVKVMDISGTPKQTQPRDIMPSSCVGQGKVQRCHLWNQRLEFKPISETSETLETTETTEFDVTEGIEGHEGQETKETNTTNVGATNVTTNTSNTNNIDTPANKSNKSNKLEDNVIGDCIHQIFCVMPRTLMAKEVLVGKLLKSYGIAANDSLIAGIIQAWENLYSFLLDNYGSGQSMHELPFKYTHNGETYTGNIDLVWMTAQGAVVVDYKTCQMKVTDIETPSSEHYAGNYAAQLDCYSTCLTKAGYTVLDKLLYYPSQGLLEKII